MIKTVQICDMCLKESPMTTRCKLPATNESLNFVMMDICPKCHKELANFIENKLKEAAEIQMNT